LVPLTFQLISLIIAAWYGAKLLSRPIQRLSDAAERLSENLDSQPLDESGPREARQAAHTFNKMQQRIREQVQQRSRMLGAVSHDLRTPLSRLKLRLEQIDDDKLQGQMRQDLDDMISMLDATLTYLHEQRTSEAPQWMDVQALIESLCENAQDQGADVQASGHCAPLQVQPMALRSCINNLLDNALRYAGEGLITLEDHREQLLIRVIDHGPGIATDKREAVFEPFYRLEGSRNRNSGGVGLGMTIAREAVERLGGQLSLEETPGGGLTAVIRLPRSL
jgi:signal transduction histidine kinase